MFILVYLKQHTMHLLPGRVFGRRQSTATPWMHVVLPVLCTTLQRLGDAPCRSVEALRQYLGEECPPVPLALARSDTAPAAPADALPLFVMTAPNDPARVPTIRRNTKRVIAGRKRGLG